MACTLAENIPTILIRMSLQSDMDSMHLTMDMRGSYSSAEYQKSGKQIHHDRVGCGGEQLSKYCIPAKDTQAYLQHDQIQDETNKERCQITKTFGCDMPFAAKYEFFRKKKSQRQTEKIPAYIGYYRRRTECHQQKDDGKSRHGIQHTAARVTAKISRLSSPSGHNIAHLAEYVSTRVRYRAGKRTGGEKTACSRVARNENRLRGSTQAPIPA